MKEKLTPENIPNKMPFFSTAGIALHWNLLKETIEKWNINLNPEYQRGYVWRNEQKIAYIEYILRGGLNGREIVINENPNTGETECIDGQQRIKTVLEFIDGEFKIFNNQYGYEDISYSVITDKMFLLNKYKFTNPKDIVNIYIGMNTGGSVHTKEDLQIAFDYLKKIN